MRCLLVVQSGDRLSQGWDRYLQVLRSTSGYGRGAGGKGSATKDEDRRRSVRGQADMNRARPMMEKEDWCIESESVDRDAYHMF